MNLLAQDNHIFLLKNLVNEVNKSDFKAMLKGWDIAYLNSVLGLHDDLLQMILEDKAELDPRTYSLLQLVTGQHPLFEIRALIDYNQLLAIQPPSPSLFKEYRMSLEVNQLQFSTLTKLNRNTVKAYDKGERSPTPQTWAIFLLATAQHPFYEIIYK